MARGTVSLRAMIVGFVGSGNMAAAMARGWAGEFDAMLFSDSRLRSRRGARRGARRRGGRQRGDRRARRPRRARGQAGQARRGRAAAGRGASGSSRSSRRSPLERLRRRCRGRGAAGDAERRRRGAPGRALRRRRRPRTRCEPSSTLLGHVVELADDDFDAATAVMGCAPAYLALAVEAIADAGAADGLDPELARELVVETDRRHRGAAARAPPGRRAQGGRLARRQHRGRPRSARPRRRPARLRGGGRGLAGEDARVIPLALSRGDVADYVSALFIVYIDPDLPQHPDLLRSRGCRTGPGCARCSTSSPRPPTPTSTSSAASCRRSAAVASRSTSARCVGIIVLFIAAGDRRRPDRTGEPPTAPRAWLLAGALCVVGLRRSTRSPRRSIEAQPRARRAGRRPRAARTDPHPQPRRRLRARRRRRGAADHRHAGRARRRRLPLRPQPDAAGDVGRDGPAGRRRDRQPGRPDRRRRTSPTSSSCRSWPPFNLADVAITFGVVLLVLIYLRDGASGSREEWLSRELRVVHLDEALAVVDKPAGLVVHPAPSHQRPDPGRRARRAARRRRGPRAPGDRPPPRQGHQRPARRRPRRRGPRGAAGAGARARGRTRLPGARRRPARLAHRHDRRPDRPRLAPARTGWRSPAPPRARRAPTSRCSSCCRARATWRRAWRPAARTRSAPTSPRSATR